MNRSQHGAVVKCEATNEIGIGEAQTTLNVYCKFVHCMRIFELFFNQFLAVYCADAPMFKESPKSVEADKNDKVTLTCLADGNPLEIVWVHDPIDRVCIFTCFSIEIDGTNHFRLFFVLPFS